MPFGTEHMSFPTLNRYVGASKNSGTQKWMVYNGKTLFFNG